MSNRRRQYLKQHHRIKYYSMLTPRTLYLHIAEAKQQVQELYLQRVDYFGKKEGATEKLKAETMLCDLKMGRICNRVTEIVNLESNFK